VKRVYASLPLSGPASVPGREVLLGARLALEARAGEAELVVLDSYETSDRDEQAVMNAREAVEDPACLAYIGDFHSSQVLLTAPLLGTAQLLQIAPVATFVGLDGPTLVRLMPNDAMGATAIAAWLREQGVQDVLVVHDLDADYGEPVGAMSADAATRAGLVARRRPVWDNAPTKADLADAEAVVYAGVGGPAIGAFWDALHALDPALWLIGTDGIAVPQLALDVSPGAAARIRLFVPQRAPFAFYGLEAMTLALDSMRTGGTDRERVADSARAMRDRDSVLGRYSLDQDGLTTTSAYGRMAIISRRLVWDLDL
jgi:branched-chain amino acid transport system substrate-binding protein